MNPTPIPALDDLLTAMVEALNRGVTAPTESKTWSGCIRESDIRAAFSDETLSVIARAVAALPGKEGDVLNVKWGYDDERAFPTLPPSLTSVDCEVPLRTTLYPVTSDGWRVTLTESALPAECFVRVDTKQSGGPVVLWFA